MSAPGVVDTFKQAREALEQERKRLNHERDLNDKNHAETRGKIDDRLEEIHVTLHGPRKTRTPKAKTA